MTYPPETVNGFMATGLGTPDFKPFTYPPDLGDRLLSEGYRVNRRTYEYGPGHEDAYLEDTCELTEHVTKAALDLLGQEDRDFFMIVYRGTDELAHGFWRHMDPTHPGHDPVRSPQYGDALLDYYRLIDRHVGRLLEAAGPDTTVLIMSDHGSGPLHKDVYLNEWLRQQGWLITAEGGRSTSQLILARLGLTRNRVSRLLRGVGLHRLERTIKDTLGDRIEVLPRTHWQDVGDAVDWSQTRAYSFGYHGQIYINLEGREPEGIVAPGAEYEALCSEITSALYSLTDPEDGKPVVSTVHRGGETFYGSNMESAPDLVVIMRDLAFITRQGYEFGNQPGMILGPTRTLESGSHRLQGLLIAAGPAIRPKAEEQQEASILDLAPTILHLLKCGIPEAMDGSILRSWLSEPLASRDSKIYDLDQGFAEREEEDLTEEEEGELVERLKQLGYLG
jgi:predicted AlkP superfamily phosphohydrolase/phosphomutase